MFKVIYIIILTISFFVFLKYWSFVDKEIKRIKGDREDERILEEKEKK